MDDVRHQIGRFPGRMAAWLMLAAGLILAGCSSAPDEVALGTERVWPPPPAPPRYYFETTLRGSGDVEERTFKDRLRFVATGQAQRSAGPQKPFDVLALDGRVFVSDTVGRRVVVFDRVGNRYFEFGREGNGKLAKPLGLASDDRRRIYVVDGTAKRVVVHDYDGNYLTAIGTKDDFDRPSGIAVSRDGSRIYVVDTGGVGSDRHRVVVFDGEGRHLFDFGMRGTDDGHFNLPHMAATAPDGSVYVVDGGNFRVQKFDRDGRFLMTFGKVGRQLGHFSRPKGIAVDGENRVFVADAAFGNFQIFDEQGRLLLFVGDRKELGGPGEFMLPAGISVDTDGRVYMADQFFRKVDVFRPAHVAAALPTRN